eukprot:INCI5369.2.p1 GENE.INCI5369.2~~INCI5369.2.p1  ORF type:complete len:528 (-),score=97.57 INCI5369.2:1880-3463(-)
MAETDAKSAASPAAETKTEAGAAAEAVGEHDWLEEVASESNLEWVRAQNSDTLQRLGNPEEAPLYGRVLDILNSKDKIPYVHRRDNWFYNFWTDDEHTQGIWRRTTLESFETPDPEWQILLDLDELSKQEGETWVWKGSVWYFEDVGVEQDICLIKLSKGGADAIVVREYDVKNARFFEPGPDVFSLPEAKTHVSYKTRDVLLVGTDFGEGSLTDSGYARTVREWRRGTPLEDAPQVFEGKKDDVIVHGSVQKCRGHTYEWQTRAVTFWTSEQFVREGIDSAVPLRKLEVQDDAKASCFGSFLLVELRSAWEVDGTTYKMGSLLSFNFRQFMDGDKSSVQVLFEPDAEGRIALSDFTTTYNFIILKLLDNVCTRLDVFHREDGAGDGPATWKKVEVAMASADGGAPEGGAGVDAQLSLWAEDEDQTDIVWLTSSGFLEPTTLLRGEVSEVAITSKKNEKFEGSLQHRRACRHPSSSQVQRRHNDSVLHGCPKIHGTEWSTANAALRVRGIRNLNAPILCLKVWRGLA